MLKALELLGKRVGLFKAKEVPEVERSAQDISNEIQWLLRVFKKR